MILNDYKCSKCKKIAIDKEHPPTCCGLPMDKIYVPNRVVWKTPGCTRTVPFPKKEDK